MPDLIVKLYTLPEAGGLLKQHSAAGIDIRRAIAPEKHIVVDWVRRKFQALWASEVDVAFSNHPASCFIAAVNGEVAGFACYDATVKNFFGPVGVDESMRGKRIGEALLLCCLHAMASQGYGYAIIGGVEHAEQVDFYAKTVGAVAIDGSTPGMYRGMLRGLV
jgi:hypothetical protein